MRRLMQSLMLATLGNAGILLGQSPFPSRPPLRDYLMPRDAEIALARSAAPASISDRATIKVLTPSGFEVASQGDNGAVCLVMRGFSAPTYTPAQFRDLVYDPTVHAPICFTAPAAKTAMPYYELRTKLAMEGKGPDQIARAVEAAYDAGQLPHRDAVTFAYMWSADMQLGPGIGAWHPHVMGTPFAVVVIPVDDRLAIKSR